PDAVEHGGVPHRVDLPGTDEFYAAVKQVVDGEIPVAAELAVNAEAGLNAVGIDQVLRHPACYPVRSRIAIHSGQSHEVRFLNCAIRWERQQSLRYQTLEEAGRRRYAARKLQTARRRRGDRRQLRSDRDQNIAYLPVGENVRDIPDSR